MNNLEIYLDPCTVNSRKVLAGLDLLGTKYEFHHVDYFAGAHKTDDYLKINPHATVPCARDGACIITESNAILQYAADLGTNDSNYPKDLKQRANVNRWLLWESSVWFQSCYIYLVEYVVKPLLNAEPDESIIAAEAPKWNKYADILDKQLSMTKWLTGEEVTIADLAVASPMHLHAAQRLPLDKYPNLTRWIGDIEALPCWKKTQGAVDKALLPGKSQNNGTQTNGSQTNGSHKDHSVQATFNYTKEVDQLTELYFYDTPKAAGIHEPGDDPKTVTITDGWSKVSTFTLDKNGFAVSDFATTYTDWQNEEAVRTTFYPEIVSLVKKQTGATRVLVFDHTIRSQANQAKKLTQETNTSQRAPVMLVHCDYTSESGPIRVQQLLPTEASDLLTRRIAFINVWKPLNVVEERPLAMCDATSAPDADFFKLHLRYRDRDGENYVMRHSDEQKWWYFPKMTPDKAIFLKTYESEMDGRARFVGHTAFEDPTSEVGAPMRESVEIRTIAFF